MDYKSSELSSEAPTWAVKVTKPEKKAKAVFGGFIVDDPAETAMRAREHTSSYVQRRREQAPPRSILDWTVSYERIVQRLNERDKTDFVTIDEAVEEVSNLLLANAQDTQPMRSLYEIAGSGLDVQDVAGVSTRLEGLRHLRNEKPVEIHEDIDGDDHGQNASLEISAVAGAAAYHLLGLHGLGTLSEALGELLPTWTASRELAPVLTRRREVLRIAADLTLASQVLRFRKERLDEQVPSQGQQQAWDLPVRPPPAEDLSQAAKLGEDLMSQRSQTPVLPTPSASASTVTGSSYPAKFAAPEIDRLSRYTTFSKNAPSALPRALNKVLSHWTIAADPAEYDWRNTARQVSRRDEEFEGDEMTEKERRQMQRRTERYIRRQRREVEESQRQRMLSSQAPEIVSASQPTEQKQGLRRAESQVSAGVGAAVGSSQSYGLGQMAASQVVPGRHGGRPPPRKKRKSGF